MPHGDRGRATFGMTMDVGKAFLHDPKTGDFYVVGQAAEIGGDDEVDMNFAARGISIDVGVERGDQAELVEQGRMQEVGDGADFAADFRDEYFVFGDGAGARFIERVGLPLNHADVHADGGEQLPHTVVQVASDAAAFLVAQ